MNKKGFVQDLWFVIMEVIILVLIIVSLFSYVNHIADGTLYWKNYYARDIALIMDTVHAAPGEVNFNYNVLNSVKPLEIHIEEDRVKVYEYRPDLSKDKLTPAAFYFAVDSKTKVEKSEFNTISFNFMKAKVFDDQQYNARIWIDEQSGLLPLNILMVCPTSITGGVLKEQKIFFRTEDPALSQLEQAIKLIFKNQVYGADEVDDWEDNIDKVKERDADLVVILDFSSDENVNTYFSALNLKSQKLACLFLLNILELDHFKDKQGFGKTSLELADEDLKKLLSQKTAVILELGPEAGGLPMNEVALAIFEGIKVYYG
ncbi:MAG: hypothetical protein ABIE94_04890 [archaeon]